MERLMNMAKNEVGGTIGGEIDQACSKLNSEKQRIQDKIEKITASIEAQHAERSTLESSLLHIDREIKKSIKAVMAKYGVELSPVSETRGRGAAARKAEGAAPVTEENKARALQAIKDKGGKEVTARSITARLGATGQPVIDALLAERKIVEGSGRGNKRSYSIA